MSKSGDDFAHLAPDARDWAARAGDEARIRRILTDRWIGYTRARRALERLEWLLRHPRRLRMPNLLIVGPTNNGKTMIAEKFRRVHVPQARVDGFGEMVPVLYLQCPDAADPRRFHQGVATALGAPRSAGDSLAKKEAQSLHLLRSAGVRILIVDEIHNILAGGSDRMNQMLNLLRFLGNELQIPIVAIGVKEALHVIHSDDQLANRFEPCALPRWTDGAELHSLLASFESALPLQQPSNLIDPKTVRRINALSEGILGEIATLLTRAAEQAILSGQERINLAALDALDFVPPSQRRASAAALGVE